MLINKKQVFLVAALAVNYSTMNKKFEVLNQACNAQHINFQALPCHLRVANIDFKVEPNHNKFLA
jgi:hypothetical protein